MRSLSPAPLLLAALSVVLPLAIGPGMVGDSAHAESASSAPIVPVTAAAPTLPDGDTLLAVDCGQQPGQVFELATTGAATPLGEPAADDTVSGCGRTGDVHPQTGKVYWVSQSATFDLMMLDLSTGGSTFVATLDGPVGACGVQFDRAGDAYTAVYNDLYRIDVETGEMSLVGSTGVDPRCAWGINPVDDEIYWFTQGGPTSSDVYRIDKTTGAKTFVVSLDVSGLDGYVPDGVVFDTAGIAWIQDDHSAVPDASSRLEAADLTTGIVYPSTAYIHDATAALYAPNPTDGKAYFYTMGFIALPAAAPDQEGMDDRDALAETGTEGSALLASALAIVMIVTGGVGVAVARRRPSVTR